MLNTEKRKEGLETREGLEGVVAGWDIPTGENFEVQVGESWFSGIINTGERGQPSPPVFIKPTPRH